MPQTLPAVLTFKDLFPNSRVTTIKTGSELYLAYCLNLYSCKELGVPFSIENCTIDKAIMTCTYMAYCLRSAYITNAQLPLSDEEKQTWMKNQRWSSFYSSDVSFIKPVSIDANSVVYSRVQGSLNDDIDFMRQRGTGYVHLLAYNIIRNYKEGTHRMLYIDGSSFIPDRHEYSNLYILSQYGNRLITPDLCSFTFAEDKSVNPEYIAWIDEKQQRNKHNMVYSPKTKYSYTKSKGRYLEGDVVLIYKTRDPMKRKEYAPLVACILGVIQEIKPDGITFLEIAKPETKLTQWHTITNIIESSRARGVKSVYTDQDKRSFSPVIRSYTWEVIGADDLSYNEGIFFTRPFSDDGTSQWLSDGVNEQEVFLNTVETCYAVLTDRGITFNKQRFMQRYFPNNTLPIYEVWEQRHKQNVARGLCK